MRRSARRLVAVLLLVAPLLAGTATMTRDCPLAPAAGARSPVLVAGMDDGGCEHTAASPCLTELGCMAVTPALRPPAVSFVTPATLIVLGAALAPHLADLYRTRPPTPPPNQV